MGLCPINFLFALRRQRSILDTISHTELWNKTCHILLYVRDFRIKYKITLMLRSLTCTKLYISFLRIILKILTRSSVTEMVLLTNQKQLVFYYLSKLSYFNFFVSKALYRNNLYEIDSLNTMVYCMRFGLQAVQ